MSFANFIGNAPTVAQLQALIAAPPMGRTLILEGPDGIGKTTLALMAGLALNCSAPPAPGDFCGSCASCTAASAPAEIPQRLAEALDYRKQEIKTRERELAPLAVTLHPQIRLYPPDGEMMTMHQARRIAHDAQVTPDRGRRWALLLPELEQARWLVQTALLKTLEEPPATTTLFLLVGNALELLPTIRSRALVLRLQPLSEAETMRLVADRRGVNGETARLLARLAEGCPGRALGLDLEAFRRLRAEALQLLRLAALGGSGESLFRLSESVRADKEKFERWHEILYICLQDILYLHSGIPERICHLDCATELRELSRKLSFPRVVCALEMLDQSLASARRNALRPLALDAWALRLAQP